MIFLLQICFTVNIQINTLPLSQSHICPLHEPYTIVVLMI